MSRKDFDLTPEEKAAIRDLKKLAQKWPKSLWLYSGAGSLFVLRTTPEGEHAMTKHGGVDPAFVVESLGTSIPNDGGDW